MEANEILIKPIITEKSMDDVAKNKFTFMVAMSANKRNIKDAVEDKFKVNVKSVATIISKGKSRRFGKRRTEVALSSWKKAIVELAAGQKIDLFDQA